MAGPRREARIDLAVFQRNLTALNVKVLDVRADAYGHGLERIQAAAREAGVTAFGPGGTGGPAYGFDRLPGTDPVLTLVGEVLATKLVPAGSGVSYGYTYRTRLETVLALVGLGFADGVPRAASNRAAVWIEGATHPVVGRIAMDQLVVECGAHAPTVGADAILFGNGHGIPTAIDWAELTGRTALELTAGLGSRIHRTYQPAGDQPAGTQPAAAQPADQSAGGAP